MELLAPAGNWDSFIAAMKNGADAVYLGGQQYSARQSAQNFEDKQVREAVTYSHLRDKKVYVTVNTLIDNGEFAEALDYLYKLQQIGVDAIIIQDMGLLDAARNVLPDLRLHASTQMTVHNQDGVSLLRDLGIKRIVLARELSMAEITAIARETSGVELEVFVHGALCYSYSGQCLFSSMIGGRSGNRGRCAQPCRLAYDLYTRNDKNKVKLPEQGRYLLSPSDLCLIDYLPELKAAGVSSLKIEGRMKRAEYVAVVTRAYRQALDRLEENPEFRPVHEVKERLLKIFNRNFSSGYFIPDSTDFLSTRRPNNRGVYVGRVVEQSQNMFTQIKLSDTVSIGDGLVVWVGQGQAPAFVIKEMYVDGNRVLEASSGEIIGLQMEGRAFPNDRVFKTHDERLLSEALKSIREKEGSRIPIDAEVSLVLGQPMQMVLLAEKGLKVEMQTQNPAQPAKGHPLNEEILRAKIGRLGNTPFELRELRISGDLNLMVPLSDINEARRQAADLLMQKILLSKIDKHPDAHSYWTAKIDFLGELPSGESTQAPLLSVAVSKMEQVEIALQNGADRVYLGMEGLGSHKPLRLAQIQELQKTKIERVVPLLPRIHKPGEQNLYRKLADEGFSSLMIASWADLQWGLNRGITLLADYSLNILNSYSLRFLCQQGVSGVCLSPELSFDNLQTFADFSKVELLIHGELILMESQHCMLGSVLGGGREKCMAPCAGNSYYLRDDKAYEFPVETDSDCRFYIFNSRTLCMMPDLPRMLALKPASMRIEARRLTDEQLADTVKLYRQALNELLKGLKPNLGAYQQDLAAATSSSFTKGHYYRGVL
ncbi:MAG: peptidase U32 [Firmicutes bacterium HGW-Firmicutes-15]|nr:MAG: peptidase U32 [Firmicutes bacterium HGW-Firmicutes-15]